MILTCEKCHTRYLLASHMLGYEGRRVRCTHCGHDWFQEKIDESDDSSDSSGEGMPEDDMPPLVSFLDAEEESEPGSFAEDADDVAEEEDGGEQNPFKSLLNKMNEEDDGEEEEAVFALSERTEEEYPPVPEGVLPDSEVKDVEQEEIPVKGKEPMDWSVAVGGALVILVLAISVAGFILFHKPIINALPATASLYKIIGIEVPVQGEGLVFDRVKAISKPDKRGKDVLYIEGNILNLTKDVKSVPKIEASLRRKDGGVADKWVFEVDTAKIAAGGSIPFSTSYSQTIKDIAEVNVRFVLR